MELLSMERALLSSSTIAMKSRCESGYRSPSSHLIASTVLQLYCGWRGKGGPSKLSRFGPYSQCYKETTPLRTPIIQYLCAKYDFERLHTGSSGGFNLSACAARLIVVYCKSHLILKGNNRRAFDLHHMQPLSKD